MSCLFSLRASTLTSGVGLPWHLASPVQAQGTRCTLCESVNNHCMALGKSHPQTIAPIPPSILQFWHFVGFAVHHWKFLCNTGMTCVLASTWAKLYTCSHFSEIIYDHQPADLIAWMAKIASKLICAIVKSFNVQSCMTG